MSESSSALQSVNRTVIYRHTYSKPPLPAGWLGWGYSWLWERRMTRATGTEGVREEGREEPLTSWKKSPAWYSVWEQTVAKCIQYSGHCGADIKKLPTSKLTVQQPAGRSVVRCSLTNRKGGWQAGILEWETKRTWGESCVGVSLSNSEKSYMNLRV